MARKRNDLPSQELRISTTPQIVALLGQLVETGLWGKNPTDAAERVIGRSVEVMLRDGSLVPLRKKANR
jgi:hypothetical protein